MFLSSPEGSLWAELIIRHGSPSIVLVYIRGAQKWHIVSLLGDVTSPTTVAYYVSITCSEHREALTVAPIADGVRLQAIRVQG